jgi:hypothetical protein
MTDASGGISPEERRALWGEVLRYPTKGGMLGGTIALVALAFVSSRFEGGASQHERETRAMLQWIVCGPLMFAALGHYSWRAVSCTYPSERPVPWGGDPQESTPLGHRIASFVTVSVLSFAALFAWTTIRAPIGAPSWLDTIVLAATACLGAAMFPLGLAAAAVRGSPLAAMPGPVIRMWRAEPRAARIASITSLAFVGLMMAAAWAAASAKTPSDAFMAGDAATTKDPTSDGLRWLVFALRAAGFYAALASFRVAGLLAREVPAIREVVG